MIAPFLFSMFAYERCASRLCVCAWSPDIQSATVQNDADADGDSDDDIETLQARLRRSRLETCTKSVEALAPDVVVGALLFAYSAALTARWDASPWLQSNIRVNVKVTRRFGRIVFAGGVGPLPIVNVCVLCVFYVCVSCVLCVYELQNALSWLAAKSLPANSIQSLLRTVAVTIYSQRGPGAPPQIASRSGAACTSRGL